MSHSKACHERAQFLADASALFRRALSEGRVKVDEHGRCKWRDHFQKRHWEDMHIAADLVVKRFYEAENSPF